MTLTLRLVSLALPLRPEQAVLVMLLVMQLQKLKLVAQFALALQVLE